MSSRRRSLLEQFLEQLMELPFWVSLVTAAALYLAFWFLPFLVPVSTFSGKVVASALASVAPWIALIAIAAGVAGEVRRRWNSFLLSRATGLERIRLFSWRDFEAVVGEAYRKHGYVVSRRGGPLPDGGIDLELRRNGEKVIVQCKHWVNRKVPVQRVRELLGVITAEGADGGILVATNGFTRDALQFAAGKPLQLMDGEALVRLAGSSAVRLAAESSEVQTRAQACPTCRKPMVLR